MGNGFVKTIDPVEIKKLVTRQAQPAIDWPTLKPLERQALLPVECFEFNLLPESIRPWVKDMAERMDDALPDYAAIGAMVALSALIGRKLGIHPKQRDDWLVVPNLWGMVIGRPAAKKTPALSEALKPLKALEAEESTCYQTESEEYAIKKTTHKLRMRAAEDQAKKAFSPKNRGGETAEQIIAAAESEAPEEPTRKRYVLNDTTIEKLGEILANNPAGVLVYRDELTGWLNSLEREDRNQDRAFFLETWNGNSSFVYDRIGRGTIDIESACVSILGGIQPRKLDKYLRLMEDGSGDDGLLQRFQLVVYPASAPFKPVDRWPDAEARVAARATFDELADIPLPEGGKIPALRFDPAGQAIFNDFYNTLHEKAAIERNPHIEAHLAKYASLMPSLALILHVATHGASGEVGETEATQAAAWCEYLESHARRVYGLRKDPLAGARILAERLSQLGSPFTCSQLHKRKWSELNSKEAITNALNALVEHGYLHAESVDTGTKPRTDYYVNPKLSKSNDDG